MTQAAVSPKITVLIGTYCTGTDSCTVAIEKKAYRQCTVVKNIRQAFPKKFSHCFNVCAYIKDPVVRIRVWWIDTLT